MCHEVPFFISLWNVQKNKRISDNKSGTENQLKNCTFPLDLLFILKRLLEILCSSIIILCYEYNFRRYIFSTLS